MFSIMTTRPFPVLCDRCRAEGLAGEAVFAGLAGLGDLLDFEPVPRRVERAAINRAIGDIALGRNRKKRKPSGGEVAAGAAGAAASVLLPFGIGALLGAGAGAAAKAARKKKPAPPPPDVPAMIERLRAVDARLAELDGCA